MAYVPISVGLHGNIFGLNHNSIVIVWEAINTSWVQQEWSSHYEIQCCVLVKRVKWDPCLAWKQTLFWLPLVKVTRKHYSLFPMRHIYTELILEDSSLVILYKKNNSYSSCQQIIWRTNHTLVSLFFFSRFNTFFKTFHTSSSVWSTSPIRVFLATTFLGRGCPSARCDMWGTQMQVIQLCAFWEWHQIK